MDIVAYTVILTRLMLLTYKEYNWKYKLGRGWYYVSFISALFLLYGWTVAGMSSSSTYHWETTEIHKGVSTPFHDKIKVDMVWEYTCKKYNFVQHESAEMFLMTDVLQGNVLVESIETVGTYNCDIKEL